MRIRLDRGNVEEPTSRKTRAPKNPYLLEVVQQPFVRVLPNGAQMTLGRDALAVLKRPTRVAWEVVDNDGAIRLSAASEKNKGDSFAVTYSAYRSSGIISIPRQFQNLLSVGKYDVRCWTSEETPPWLKFKVTPEPTGLVNEYQRVR